MAPEDAPNGTHIFIARNEAVKVAGEFVYLGTGARVHYDDFRLSSLLPYPLEKGGAVLRLDLQIEPGHFDDEDALGEILDVLSAPNYAVTLRTGESELAGTWLDNTGEDIPCYVKRVEVVR